VFFDYIDVDPAIAMMVCVLKLRVQNTLTDGPTAEFSRSEQDVSAVPLQRDAEDDDAKSTGSAHIRLNVSASRGAMYC
jgi:hypothetical protein